MIPRMTTVGTLKNYRYDLNRSNNTLAKAMQTVTTRRNFNSYAEDPALAVRCFQIRRSYHRAESQLTVNDSLRHKYDVAWEALNNVSTDLYALAADTSLTSVIKAMSDPTGPGRTALGQSLVAKAQDIVQTMNGRYGENYVFAGADTLNAPFTWEPQENPNYIDPAVAEEKLADPNLSAEDRAKYEGAFQYIGPAPDNKLTNDVNEADEEPEINPDYKPGSDPADPDYVPQYYDKDTGEGTDDPAQARMVPVKNPAYDEEKNTSYKYLKADGTGTNERAEARTVLNYRGVPVDSMEAADQEQLKYFRDSESKYIDVGLGHKEENGEAISSTVFDSALQGVYFLGDYGTTEVEIEWQGNKMTVENIPQNVVSVINEMGEILQRCSIDDGRWSSDEDQQRFMALVQQFEDGTGTFRERWTELDTQAGFLRDNSELLENTADSLLQQYMELEEADPAAAISEFMFAKYCYDAALKVGNSVLSQSLMDYMSF